MDAKPKLSQEKTIVLLVDADPATQEHARDDLKSAGCDVYCANDGAHALRVIESKFSKMTPTIIIIDICLPQLSGFELVRRLSEKYDPRKVPFLMTSKYASPEDNLEVSNLGAHGPIQKPLSTDVVDQLFEKLRMRKLKSEIGGMVFEVNYD